MAVNITHAWKCTCKILSFCIVGKNKFYFSGMLIFTAMYVFVEHRDIRTSYDLISVFKNESGYTINGYVAESIKVFIMKLLIHTFIDLATAKIYFTSLKAALSDFLRLDWVDFHHYLTAELLNKQHDKGEAAAIVIYFSLVSVIMNFASVVLAIYEIKSKTTLYFGVGMIFSGLIHLIIFLGSNRVFNKIQNVYVDVKNASRSMIENESSNFNIIKTYNLEESSQKRVNVTSSRRFGMRLKYAILKSKYGLLYKLVELGSCIPLFILYYSDVISGDFLDANVSRVFYMCEGLRTLLNSVTKVNEHFNIYSAHETEITEKAKRPICLNTICTVKCTDIEVPGIFSNVNFVLERNEKMAVVGANGSGKTTLLRALSGLIECNGSIKIDGYELAFIDRKNLYTHLTFVSQSDAYTEGTVMSNLKYGNDAGDEEVIARCKEFGVHNVFSELEGGYMKNSESLGTELSGGQRQRVGFMRGIIRNTPMLIVDDCLSGVNTNDRRILFEGLLREKEKIVIAVSRSYDFLKGFDKILLLRGNDTRVGTFEELQNELEVLFKANLVE